MTRGKINMEKNISKYEDLIADMDKVLVGCQEFKRFIMQYPNLILITLFFLKLALRKVA